MKQIYLISPSLQASTQARITDNSYSLGLGYLHAVIVQEGYRIEFVILPQTRNISLRKTETISFPRGDSPAISTQ